MRYFHQSLVGFGVVGSLEAVAPDEFPGYPVKFPNACFVCPGARRTVILPSRAAV
jgi:hypothetical protein